MSMTCSQNLEHLTESGPNNYDDDITVTDIPQGYFMAITANTAPGDGATTRQIRVDLMPAEWANGGTHTASTNLYVRREGEAEVNVKVYNGSTLQCENTQAYS